MIPSYEIFIAGRCLEPAVDYGRRGRATTSIADTRSGRVQRRPTSCSDRNAVLDSVAQRVPVVEPVIVISRRGDGETRADLGWHRLLNVRAYWTKFLPAEIRRKPETIILGEGEKVGGFRRLELYIRGKLFYVIKLRRNENLLVGECYPHDDSYIRNGIFNPCEVKSNRIFYPCLGEKRRRGRRAR